MKAPHVIMHVGHVFDANLAGLSDVLKIKTDSTIFSVIETYLEKSIFTCARFSRLVLEGARSCKGLQ